MDTSSVTAAKTGEENEESEDPSVNEKINGILRPLHSSSAWGSFHRREEKP